jgi:hypothetical protein
MGKLHQLLAVESDLDQAYKNALHETQVVFEKKSNLFFGFIKTLHIFDESDATHYTDERHELTTTVPKRLAYQDTFIANYIDALLQKEATNQLAMANLVVNGLTLAEDMPATFLLGLEKRLVAIRAVYKTIPTLPQGTAWEVDTTQGDDIFKTVFPDVKFKTKKTFNHKVLYEATKEHPAQIEKWDETENIGEYSKVVWSGLVPSADKAAILKRIDDLIIAVKKARQQANNCDVVTLKVGQKIMDYINLGQ